VSARRLSARIAFVALLAMASVTVGMSSALAHVEVSSEDATQGGGGIITFTMPNESATATVIKLTIQVPAATPIADATLQAVPGWTSAVTMQTLPKPIAVDGRQEVEALDTIVWTATDAGLPVGQYQQFSIDAELLPKAPTVVFKALQSYSDGTEVDWIELPAPGSTTEPDHPAPTLTLAAAGSSTDSHSGAGSDGITADGTATSSTGHGLAVSALVVGILAILVSAFAVVLVSRRRVS
jgi:uncharacterized protein YcnI